MNRSTQPNVTTIAKSLLNEIRRAVLAQDAAKLRMIGFVHQELESLSFYDPKKLSVKGSDLVWFSLSDQKVIENYRSFLVSLR